MDGARSATEPWLGGYDGDTQGGSLAAPLVPSPHSLPQLITTSRALSQLVVKAASTRHVFSGRPSRGERQESNPIRALFSQLIGTEVSRSTISVPVALKPQVWGREQLLPSGLLEWIPCLFGLPIAVFLQATSVLY